MTKATRLYIAALVLVAGRAEGGFLNDTVRVTRNGLFPDTVLSDGGSKVIDPVATYLLPLSTPDSFQVTVSDTQINITTKIIGIFGFGPFTGFVITDLSRDPGIVGVTSTSNVTGFTPSLVSFTSSSVSVNLAMLPGVPTSFVTINLQFADTVVPEPSSMVSAGLGVLGLMGFALRRKCPGRRRIPAASP